MDDMDDQLQRDSNEWLLGLLACGRLGLLLAPGILEDRQDDVHAMQQIIQESARKTGKLK